MQLLKKDLTLFTLHKATRETYDDGDGDNVYNDEPDAEFWGHIQPAAESNMPMDMGLSLEYTYIIFTTEDRNFIETDRVFDGGVWYEVVSIKRWRTYTRLTVREAPQWTSLTNY